MSTHNHPLKADASDRQLRSVALAGFVGLELVLLGLLLASPPAPRKDAEPRE